MIGYNVNIHVIFREKNVLKYHMLNLSIFFVYSIIDEVRAICTVLLLTKFGASGKVAKSLKNSTDTTLSLKN